MIEKPILPLILGVLESEGEIYYVELPHFKDSPAYYVGDDICIDLDRVGEGKVHRLWCANQPVCRHRSLGNRGGFERSVSFQAVKVSDSEYNAITRFTNNMDLAFLVPDGKEHLQVVYDPFRRAKINIVGRDPEHHIIRATVNTYPLYRPMCYLVRPDGQRVEQHEIEEIINE